MSGNEVLYVRSSKKKNALNSDEASTNEDDVWDDSLLIEAYDKAVDIAYNEVLKNMQGSADKGKEHVGKSKKKLQWNVGDHCRCEYSEDHTYYEADIIDINKDLDMCVVKYVGYENEEEVPLNKLKPSKGDVYRTMQMKQALQENNIKDSPSVEKLSGSGSFRSRRKRKGSKRSERFKSKEKVLPIGDVYLNSSDVFQPTSTGVIPPPPPPHMFSKLDDKISESDALNAMLMSWYMSGYHTGYYQGLKAAKKK